MDRFLNPEESDVELIRLYFQNLLSRRLQPHWSPLLYAIAVHHVNRFIYNQEKKHTRLKHAMILQLQKATHTVRPTRHGNVHFRIIGSLMICKWGWFLSNELCRFFFYIPYCDGIDSTEQKSHTITNHERFFLSCINTVIMCNFLPVFYKNFDAEYIYLYVISIVMRENPLCYHNSVTVI